jgi:hypothetical protein
MLRQIAFCGVLLAGCVADAAEHWDAPYEPQVFDKMKKLGGNMKFTVWQGDNHGVSGRMIVGADNGATHFSSDRCDKELDFMTWLFAQSRQKSEK